MIGKVLFKNPHEMAKKDAHPVLTDLFPVAPALANGANLMLFIFGDVIKMVRIW